MSLITNAKSTYEPIQPGSYGAVCIAVVDVGNMTGPFGEMPKVWVQWEVDELNAAGERYTVSKLYTRSISRKAKLRQDLETWRGKAFTSEELKGFDLKGILGKPCLLAISITTKDDKVYNAVDSVAALPKTMAPIEPVRELLSYDTDNPDPSVLEKLPEWLARHIESAPEFAVPPQTVAPPKSDSDVPF